MKEMLSNALSGNRGGGLFAVQDPNHVAPGSARQGFFPGSAGGSGGGGGGGGMMGNDGFAIPSAISIPSTANTTTGDAMAEAQRRAMAAHSGVGGTGSGGGGPGGGGMKNTARRPSVVLGID